MIQLPKLHCCRSLFSSAKVLSSVRRLTSNSTANESDQKFRTIYSLPDVRLLAAFNRIKIYQYIATAVTLPLAGLLEHLGHVPETSTATTALVGIGSSILLTLVSLVTKNFIAFLYISQDEQNIKMSYADFWGRRVDKVVPITDWIRLSELSPSYLMPFYYKVRLYSSDDEFKLALKLGKDVDYFAFDKHLE